MQTTRHKLGTRLEEVEKVARDAFYPCQFDEAMGFEDVIDLVEIAKRYARSGDCKWVREGLLKLASASSAGGRSTIISASIGT